MSQEEINFVVETLIPTVESLVQKTSENPVDEEMLDVDKDLLSSRP